MNSANWYLEKQFIYRTMGSALMFNTAVYAEKDKTALSSLMPLYDWYAKINKHI